MPLIADPGFELGRAAAAAGYLVTVAPGASAVPTALALSGLPTDSFFFGGFLPSSSAARRARLEQVRAIPATLVFFESPKRVAASVQDMVEVLGGDRRAALCRELTKKFEEIRRAPLAELADVLAQAPVKGEVVLVIDRAHSIPVSDSDLEIDLKAAMIDHSLRDAADLVARMHDVPRRAIYQMALKLGKD